MNCLLLSALHYTPVSLACHWQPLFPFLPLDFQHGSSEYTQFHALGVSACRSWPR